MRHKERGISPAELTPKERRIRLPYSDIMQSREKLLEEKGLEIAHEITSTFIIDQEGGAIIFREFRGNIVMHSFESLPRALDQVERVIQHKLGFQRKIGEVFINIYGENEDLVRIGTMLLIGADKYYELPLSARGAYSKSLARKAKTDLEKKHNIHKKAAAEVLKQILESDVEYRDDAKNLIKAGKDAFDAAISGVRIVGGETARLVRGQFLFEHWGNQSLKIHEGIASYYKQLQTLNRAVKKLKGKDVDFSPYHKEKEKLARKMRENLARRMAGKFKDQGSFWQRTAEIKANPFFKRFHTTRIEGLIELPYMLTTDCFGAAEKKLADAVTELSALERDFDRGKIRLLQLKSTSRP